MASREKDFQEVFRQVTAKKGKQLLAKVLQFPEFDEEDDLRTAILLDLYYDALSFVVNRGFPWREVVEFFELFKSLLHETQGKSLVEAISLFKEQLSTSTSTKSSSDNNLKTVVDYTFTTLFQHYKLYQFVLTRERVDDITKVHSTVEPPIIVPAMSEGVQKSLWDEKQRLQQIDEMEQKRTQEREAYYENEMEHAMQQLEQPLSQLDFGTEELTREQLATVIGDVTAREAAVTDTTIRQKIDEIHDSLEYKYLRANAGQDNDSQGKKSASSRRSKGRSGKK